jgi:hypothetical protein
LVDAAPMVAQSAGSCLTDVRSCSQAIAIEVFHLPFGGSLEPEIQWLFFFWLKSRVALEAACPSFSAKAWYLWASDTIGIEAMPTFPLYMV